MSVEWWQLVALVAGMFVLGYLVGTNSGEKPATITEYKTDPMSYQRGLEAGIAKQLSEFNYVSAYLAEKAKREWFEEKYTKYRKLYMEALPKENINWREEAIRLRGELHRIKLELAAYQYPVTLDVHFRACYTSSNEPTDI